MSKTFEFVRRAYQAQGGVAEATVAAWERRHGLRLPEDYRRFLLATNGGALRPYAFDLVVPDPAVPGPVHALTCLHDWDAVLEQSQEDIDPEQRTLPPHRLAIGDTEDELALLLRLDLEDREHYGFVDVWVRDIYNAWGEGGNTVMVPLARSFGEFLGMLHGDPAHMTYHSYWADHDAKGKAATQLSWP